MSTKAVHAPVPEADLWWPFSACWTPDAWNGLYGVTEPVAAADKPVTDQTRRSRYRVSTRGHCGACQTPRDALGAVDRNHHLQGATVAGHEAPSLTLDALATDLRRHWGGVRKPVAAADVRGSTEDDSD